MAADSRIDWHDDAVRRQVMARIDQELGVMGDFAVAHMQGYAPVDTGALRAGIYSEVDETTHTLLVHSPVFYSIYQEFGTRFIRPHPFIRPTIADMQRRWKFVEVTLILRPPPQKSEPLIASASGFRLPRRQRLTAAQVAHVRQHLIPTSRRLARRIRRRGTTFTVQ